MTCHYPYGAKRPFDGNALPTQMDYTFTGQKSDDSTGLMFYNARYYDTTIGRFTQADTIVPNLLDPQSFNRYAYTLNNPVRYTDPTGHMVKDEDDSGGGSDDTEHAEEEDDYVITPENADDYYKPSAYPNGKECWPKCNDMPVSTSCNSEFMDNPCEVQRTRAYAKSLDEHEIANRSTLQIGYAISGSGMGYGGSFSVGPVCAGYDYSCDIQATFAGGGSTGWGAFQGAFAASTNAYSTKQLTGASGMIGGTTPPIARHSVAVDFIKQKSTWEGKEIAIDGRMATVGPGAKVYWPISGIPNSPNKLAIPFEVHAYAGWTVSLRDLLGFK